MKTRNVHLSNNSDAQLVSIDLEDLKMALDVKITPPLMSKFRHTFQVIVGNTTYLYIVLCHDIKWDVLSGMMGEVAIEKYKVIWMRGQRVLWKNCVWRVSSREAYKIIDVSGSAPPSHHGTCGVILERAINAGIMPADLLLDRCFQPIQRKLREEQRRVNEVRSAVNEGHMAQIA